MSPDGKWLLAGNWTHRDVSLVNLELGREVRRIVVGGNPRGIAFSPDSSKVYLSAESGQRVMVYTFATGTLRTLIPAAPGRAAPPRHRQGGPVPVRVAQQGRRRREDRHPAAEGRGSREDRRQPADDRAGTGRPQPVRRQLREPDGGQGPDPGHGGPPAPQDPGRAPGRASTTTRRPAPCGWPATGARSSASPTGSPPLAQRQGSGRQALPRSRPNPASRPPSATNPTETSTGSRLVISVVGRLAKTSPSSEALSAGE